MFEMNDKEWFLEHADYDHMIDGFFGRFHPQSSDNKTKHVGQHTLFMI